MSRKWLKKNRPWLFTKEGKANAEYRRRKRYESYMKSAEWQAIRRMALRYFQNKCFKCESVFDLEVHHLTYKNLGHESIEDVVVLCANCHAAEHAKKHGRIRKHIRWKPQLTAGFGTPSRRE